MMPMLLTVGLLGGAIGSFVNVVAYRLPRSESVVAPRSACPACGHRIRAWHNIPILSWLLLMGRCHDCYHPIPFRYLLVELLTAALFGLFAWQLGVPAAQYLAQGDVLAGSGHTIVLLAHLALIGIGMALALIDLDTHRLPNALTLGLLITGAASFTLAAGLLGQWGQLGRAALGALLLFLLYLCLWLIAPRGMGAGDVKLAPGLGLFLAWHSWGALAAGAIAAFAIGTVFGLVRAAATGEGRRTRIPFGPSMLAGAALGILCGGALTGWYLDVFSLASHTPTPFTPLEDTP
ncbi:A24 family peptidase [Nesterenkonia sp. NBAIMH1]|uniref:prepilin peptidase n=1 Tax=Nesterenkonia sp. NBAIMH1 TaxID=2600320 RepID=UPI0011B43A6A|nr:A24 family peptidase [Nesterenkonia sp. NBAIMH1]